MTRVIHTGDTHVGYRQYHSPERRVDFLDAFRRVVEDAIDGDADAVVHAGDLFHDRRPALSDIHGAISVLRELREAGIPFLAVVGNHERTRDEQWLDLFETLGLATRLGREPTVLGDVAFYGLDYVPRSARDDLDYDFAPHDADHAALVAHGLFTPFNAEWDVEEVLSASPVAFDAVLLGDDHQPDTAEVSGTWVTYCGSTERTSAAEREERGYNIVEFDGGASIRRRGIETREFVTVDVELGPGEGADRVRERLREEDLDDAVVVVSVEGEGEEVSPAAIEEFATERGALIARVTDRRELEAEDVGEVRFADPDEAVRERLRGMGLSEAAMTVDEVVRSDLADSNVRDRARERVEALLEDDPESFTTAATVGDPGDADATDAGDGPDDPAAEPSDEGSEGADEAGEDDVTGDVAGEIAGNAEDGEGDGGETEDVPETEDDGDDEDDGDAPEAGDGQVTMEDYF